MTIISVMYPNTSGSHFDLDYYRNTHMPLVTRLCKNLGLRDMQILLGVASVEGGSPAFRVTALLTFGSTAEFQNAMAAHGAEIIADIANFTDAPPILQINEPLG